MSERKPNPSPPPVNSPSGTHDYITGFWWAYLAAGAAALVDRPRLASDA